MHKVSVWLVLRARGLMPAQARRLLWDDRGLTGICASVESSPMPVRRVAVHRIPERVSANGHTVSSTLEGKYLER